MDVTNQNTMSTRLFRDVAKEEIKEEAGDWEYQNEEKDYMSCFVEMESFQFAASEEECDNEEVMEPLLAVFLQPEEVIEVSSGEEKDPLALDLKTLPVIAKEEYDYEDADDDEYTATEEFAIAEKGDICNEPTNRVGKDKCVLQESFTENFNSENKKSLLDANRKGISYFHDNSKDVHKLTKQKHFICAICQKCFSRRCELKEHMQDHTTPNCYSCKICKRLYSEKDYVCDHIREYLQPQTFECLICRESFSSKASCDTHMQTHVRKKLCLCKVCNKCFTKKSLLQEHLRIHMESKLFECPICEKYFMYKSTLARHMKLHQIYKCRICNERFTQKVVFECHVRLHSGKETFECFQCHKTFSSSKACCGHMRIHKQERSKCNICHEYFSGNRHKCFFTKTNTKQSNFQQSVCKSQLSSNRQAHSVFEKLYCYICNKKFLSRGGFYRHKKLHVMKPYRCGDCKELFSQYDLFLLHISVNHENKPFTCNTCPKNFSMKENLLKHLLTHTWNKPNECNTCHKSFSNNVKLLRHMLTHVGKTQR